MSHSLAASFVLLVVAATGAQAQVYRCEHRPLYTDKPCYGAAAVDVRPNLLDAGPRGFPALPVPAPAVILPDNRPKEPLVGGASSVWQNRDAQDAQFRSRTGGR